MHTERWPLEDECRNLGESSISQGMSKIVSKPPEATGET